MIDKKIIERSKKYAAAHNLSLSDLVESYLLSITVTSAFDIRITDKVKRLKGSFKSSSSFDYKKILQEEICRKHG
jgi:hypothetical protein